MTLAATSKLSDYPLGDLSKLNEDRLRLLRWEGLVEGCEIARKGEISKSLDSIIKNCDKRLNSTSFSASNTRFATNHTHQPLRQQEYRKLGENTNEHNAVELTDKRHNIVRTRDYQYQRVGANNQRLFGYANAPAFDEYYSSQPERGVIPVGEVPEHLKKKKRSKRKKRKEQQPVPLEKKTRMEQQPVPMDIDQKISVRIKRRREPVPMDIDHQSIPLYKHSFNSLGDNVYKTTKLVKDSEDNTPMEDVILVSDKRIVKKPQSAKENYSCDVVEIDDPSQKTSSSATPLESTPLKRKPRSKTKRRTKESTSTSIKLKGSEIVEIIDLDFDGDVIIF